MWSNKKKPKQTAHIDSLIGQNTEVKGDVVFSGGLHVDGNIKGGVIADQGNDSVLTLSERGTIEGEVKVGYNNMYEFRFVDRGNDTLLPDLDLVRHISQLPAWKEGRKNRWIRSGKSWKPD